MQSIQTLNALSHAIDNFPIIYECGCLGTASWFVFNPVLPEFIIPAEPLYAEDKMAAPGR